MREYRRQVCVDFDGVIHSYSKGWQDGQIYDDVTPGFFEWASSVKNDFDIVIYSSRSRTPEGIQQMKDWLALQIHKFVREHNPVRFLGMEDFKFASEKPAAWITIDDRAHCFTGDWSQISLGKLEEFVPWNDPYGKKS